MIHSRPQPTRFSVGKTYRLVTSDGLPSLKGGILSVKSELSTRDRFGTRILLADVHIDSNECNGNPVNLLGVRCFVEEGYTEVADSYGSRTIPVEIASVQGLYPFYAKAYANAEVPDSKNRSVA